MSFRKAVFWVHLASGLIAGVVIAIMSVTGVAIAFEEEILAWRDREVSRAALPQAGAARLTPDELRARSLREYPDFAVTRIVVPRDPLRACELYAGREGPLYTDPHTGKLRESRAHALHEFLHELEEWHRWLGLHGKGFAFGRAITGACNLALVILCLTGLWLWFPRTWSRRALRPRLWFSPATTTRARDYTWHHVIGLWSFPVLLVLAVTAVVISYGWAHRLVFTLAGEEAPQSRNFGMMAMPPAIVPAPSPSAERLPLDRILATAREHFPDARHIGIHFPQPAAPGAPPAPLKLDVTLPDFMPSRAYVPVEMDPYTGEILQAVRFQDRSAGLQARVWMRFLHTGAGLGLPGKIIATLATLASLVLVYTGFALSWRRFLKARGLR
ncbi:MAG: peptidase [Rariglobus sp.]|jgi:uncharacterized iron-regulated membrane protein|nr:peptidase [Rariglobus sp.]